MQTSGIATYKRKQFKPRRYAKAKTTFFAEVYENETFLRVFNLVGILLLLQSFIWIYTAGEYVLDAATSKQLSYFTRFRLLFVLLTIGYAAIKGDYRDFVKALPLLAIVGFFLPTIAWSSFFADSVRGYLLLMMQMGMGLLLCAQAPYKLVIERLRWISIAIILINLVFIALVSDDIARDSGYFLGGYDGALRGIFPSKNLFGGNMSMFATFLLASLAYQTTWKGRLIDMLFLLIVLGLLVEARSATSIVALGIAFAVIFPVRCPID